MDFFSDGRRRVNLSGARGGGSEEASRAALIEQTRLQRQNRQQEKARENAAAKVQAFFRSRRMHIREAARQRALWDAELPALAASASAAALAVAVRRYSFFSLATKAHRHVPRVPAARTSAARAALLAADVARFRQLVKLLLVSLRSPSRQAHFGSLLLQPGGVPQWLHSTRSIARLLLEHIGSTASCGMDHASSEVALLWLMLDSTQWPFVKDAAQCTPQEKQLIQQTQSALVRSLVAPLGQARLASAPSAPSHAASAAASSSSAARPSRPVIDLFHCLRLRILDLSVIPQDGVATPAQLAQKTSLALMFATIIRTMTLCVGSGAAAMAADGGVDNPVLLSFVYHVLSIPALPQRLRFLQLQALIPSFLSANIWDRSMEALAHHVRRLLFRQGSASSADDSTALAFQRSVFSSMSFSWHDSAAQSQQQPRADDDSASSPSAMDLSVAPRSYAFFSSSSSSAATRRPDPISGLAWLFGNALELIGGLDENKSEATSRSFTLFLLAIDQLIQAVPRSELPALAADGNANSSANSAENQRLPPAFTKQFAVFGERAFLDRLCRRLLAEPAAPAASSSASSGGDTPMPSASPPLPSADVSTDVPIICILIDTLLFRWSASSNSILNTLVFSSDIVRRLWTSIQRSGLLARIEAMGKGPILNLSPFPSAPAAAAAASSASYSLAASSASAAASSSAPSLSLAPSAASLEALFNDRFFNLLPLFCTMFGHLLMILDDDEFFVKQQPFNLKTDIIPLVGMLKTLLYHLYWSAFSQHGTPARLRERFSKLFIQLRDRQSRKPFAPPEAWLFSPAIDVGLIQSELMQDEELRYELSGGDASRAVTVPVSRAASLVSSIPFVLPFTDRVKLFYGHIQSDKQRQRDGGVMFDHGMGRRIRIRRKFVLEDSYAQLSNVSSSDLKGRIQIQFTDEHGQEEAGLDGGGLFKEFLTTLLKTAFDPSYNLFSETAQHFIYPNPNALDLPVVPAEDGAMLDDLGEEAAAPVLQYFHFLGQMVGKALYEGIQIEALFALFFLRYCIGLQNYLNDLQGLDPVIYNSLMKLKQFPASADIADLGLTFSVDRQTFGVTKTIDLIPNGANVPVTNDNKLRFIYAMSDFYLNRQMSKQSQAFQAGMASIVDTAWLRMFAAEELRLLISGSQAVNLADLQKYTTYHGGYSKDHEAIRWFWQCIAEMDNDEVASMLKFVTSCSRAPLLGFQHMNPGFAIQRVDVNATETTLPTAATCMNLLRLPRYSSPLRMKEKLLYAFASGAGFGLT